MKNVKRLTFFLFFFFSCFFLTACDRLEKIDNKIGQAFGWEAKKQKTEEQIEQTVDLKAGELSIDLKEKIDEWLKENGFNRYGDAIDTYYSGGTPLFDEVSGETRERFEYILEKHPDIINKIKTGL